MRRVIMLISLTFLLLGCTASKVSSPNENIKENEPILEPILKKQQYSFGPMADISKIDDKTKQDLQDQLDRLGDPPKDRVTFNEISAFYDEEGSLVVDLFIRNGYSYPVFNLEATLDIIENGKIIASAPFSFIVQDFGELPSNTSRPWTILYYPEDVKNKQGELIKYDIKISNLQYEY